MTQPSTPARSKKFYKDVTIDDAPDGFRVELDGRSIKTPLRNTLVVPARALAEAIAVEWDRQSEEIDLDTMPLTRLAQRAVDSAGHGRSRMIDEILKFSGSDLLCYRATDPAPLVKHQTAEWQPVLDWAKETLGVRLEVTDGLDIIEQPASSLQAIRTHVENLTDFELAGLSPAVALLGSVILGLAFHRGYLSAAAAINCALLEELWQSEQWGKDDEASARRRNLGQDLENLEKFLRCLM